MGGIPMQAFEEFVEIARREIATAAGSRLPLLQTYLEKGKRMLDLSSTKMRSFAKQAGLCLANFTLYGSGLRQFLRSHPCQRIRLHKVKRYALVKFFLVKL